VIFIMEAPTMLILKHQMTLIAAIAFWILTAGIICYRGQSLVEPSLILALFIMTVLMWDKFDPGNRRVFRREEPPGD
jgi:hypothetical protein